jgi:hypothetical protein
VNAPRQLRATPASSARRGVQHLVQPRPREQLLLVAAARPAPSHHSRSPQTVDSARPWAVGVPLGVVQDLLAGSSAGSLHPGRQPVQADRSPDRAISASHWRRSARVAMKLPSGWQNPSAASSPSSRSRLSPTSVLEIPPPGGPPIRTARPAAPRPQRPGAPPTPAAGCRPARAGGVGSGGPAERPSRAAKPGSASGSPHRIGSRGGRWSSLAHALAVTPHRHLARLGRSATTRSRAAKPLVSWYFDGLRRARPVRCLAHRRRPWLGGSRWKRAGHRQFAHRRRRRDDDRQEIADRRLSCAAFEDACPAMSRLQGQTHREPLVGLWLRSPLRHEPRRAAATWRLGFGHERGRGQPF